MKDFAFYLEKNGEVGFADQVFKSIVHAHGLPNAHPKEVLLFESGELGYVLALNADTVEIAMISQPTVKVGTRIARTDSTLKIHVGDELMGTTITSQDIEKTLLSIDEDNKTDRPIDENHTVFGDHTKVGISLETQVTMVDLLVPLGKGQRELIIGDRKTGKTSFLLQTIRAQADKGFVCIYVSIAKTQQETRQLYHSFQSSGIAKNSIIITSNSADRPGLIFLTPYIAVTIAEYFRDQGKDVIVVLDDLTTHARYYREIMLLTKRFPGRNSYPGDIFYIHSRLLERAGNYKKGSITCLPVAQSVVSDLSGYIQTNLMSMTDGHIFFDSDLFDQGRRPAINPFISVTRVGEQTQTPLRREISRQLRGFLTNFEKIKQFKHFQNELSENVKASFNMGEQLTVMLDQLTTTQVPVSLSTFLFGAIWGELWKNIAAPTMKEDMDKIIAKYHKESPFKQKIEDLVQKSTTLAELTQAIKDNQELVRSV